VDDGGTVVGAELEFDVEGAVALLDVARSFDEGEAEIGLGFFVRNIISRHQLNCFYI
jgi:hypothetical protein